MQGMPQPIIVAHSSHNPKQKALDSLQQQHKPDIRLVAIWLKQRSQRKIGSCHFKDEERPYSSLPPACLHPQFALSQMKWKYFLNVVLILSSLYTDCQGCGCIPSTWGFLCLCSGPAQPGCMCLASAGAWPHPSELLRSSSPWSLLLCPWPASCLPLTYAWHPSLTLALISSL